MGRGDSDRPENDREVVSTEDIEMLITQLPGVVSARLVVDDWGAIQEVHVLSTSERAPKQLVRDIESALAARWGISIDHKRISIAQLQGVDESDSHARLQLTAVTVSNRVKDSEATVQVELAAPLSDRAFVGSHSGPGTRPHLLRTAAIATIEAINAAVQPRFHLVFEEVGTLDLNDRQIVVAVVRLQGSGDAQVLVGSALVRNDAIDAVIRACLDATNRRLSRAVAE